MNPTSKHFDLRTVILWLLLAVLFALFLHEVGNLYHMAAKNHVIEIPLMGQKVVLKTQADPKLVEEVTALVIERLAASEKRVKNANAPHLAALLALFDVAEDYVEAKRKLQSHQVELLEKVTQLQTWVDSALNGV